MASTVPSKTRHCVYQNRRGEYQVTEYFKLWCSHRSLAHYTPRPLPKPLTGLSMYFRRQKKPWCVRCYRSHCKRWFLRPCSNGRLADEWPAESELEWWGRNTAGSDWHGQPHVTRTSITDGATDRLHGSTNRLWGAKWIPGPERL